MITIYYVEDDLDIAENVKTHLEIRQMEVSVFYSIADAKQALLKKRPELILVDRNMPDGDGDELCRWIRRLWGNQLPILYLTVRGETADIVQGFQNGADDYVVKPFELEVLYSRILALLRRSGQAKETRLFCDNLLLDIDKMSVFCEQEEVMLSQPEYQLLLLLMENKGKTVTRKQLLERVWDSNGNYVNDNTLTVTMKRLREKLHNPTCLKTIRSFGYRMEESV
ncbi:response regulator transcription factor [Enterocloster clostridioformis]|uniref:response regulator transcription factor n=1 Tax=Enterocloster clostridioformis TaxID=1531 RepID=UPI0008E49A7B|nr:response regulator transcription factor [Enterocloster clostridioformis]SFG87900.1 DNA-binding response regulator, OmpR family, contains REC and winged-helix (wHTH) domain [Enterocloster clostridioformis]